MWMITYDADRRVPDELYPNLRYAVFGIKHTAAVQHIGQEYAVFSTDLSIPDLTLLGHNARLIA
jgi:DNA adenine methylase